MRSSWMIVMLGLAACGKDKDAEKTPPAKAEAGKPGEPAKTEPAKAEPAKTEPAKPAPTAAACDGRTATLASEGRDLDAVTLTCTDGERRVTYEHDGEETVPPQTRVLDEAAWNAAWAQLDALDWQKLPDACGTVDPEDRFAATIQIVITTKDATRKFTCGEPDIPAGHQKLIDALLALGRAPAPGPDAP